MIQINHSLFAKRSFAASLGIHTLFGWMFFSIAMHYPSATIDKADRLSITLNSFHEVSDNINKIESAPIQSSASSLKHPIPPFKSITAPMTTKPLIPSTLKTLEKIPSTTMPDSSEAFAPLVQSTAPASSPPSTSTDSPKILAPSSPKELPKSPVIGHEIGGAAFGHIRSMIEKSLIYPYLSRKLRQEGNVMVFFILRPDGTVDEAKVTSSSGYKLLDEKAIQTIFSLSGDFPKLGKTIELTIPIAFNLK